MIRSALARPYHGYYPDIHQKAAALIHAIVSNHGFVDGNKRTALYLTELFVQRSGYELTIGDPEFVEALTSVACGQMSCENLAEWIRNYLIPSCAL